VKAVHKSPFNRAHPALIAAMERLLAVPLPETRAQHAQMEAWATRLVLASIMQVADLPRAKNAGSSAASRELVKFVKLAGARNEFRDHILSMHRESLSALEEFGGSARHPLILADDLAKFEVLFGQDIDDLSAAAKKGLKALDGAPRLAPRKVRQEGHKAVAEMAARAFKALTGKGATRRSREGSAYGPFLDFLGDVFRALEMRGSVDHYARLVL